MPKPRIPACPETEVKPGAGTNKGTDAAKPVLGLAETVGSVDVDEEIVTGRPHPEEQAA